MSFHEPASGSAPRRRNVATATMFCSSTPTRFVPFATLAGQAEQDQERQRQQRAAAGERVDEAGDDADQGHGGEQQRVLIHAMSTRRRGTVPHSSHNVRGAATRRGIAGPERLTLSASSAAPCSGLACYDAAISTFGGVAMRQTICVLAAACAVTRSGCSPEPESPTATSPPPAAAPRRARPRRDRQRHHGRARRLHPRRHRVRPGQRPVPDGLARRRHDLRDRARRHASCRSFATRSSCRRSASRPTRPRDRLLVANSDRAVFAAERHGSSEARRLQPDDRRAARDGRSRCRRSARRARVLRERRHRRRRRQRVRHGHDRERRSFTA